MAVTQDPRFGTDIYSAGSDPYPARAGWNAQLQKFWSKAVKAVFGADRGPAGIEGRIWRDPTTKAYYWDTGTAWEEMSPTRSAAAPTGIVPGQTAAPGTSRTAAREDHRHPVVAPTDEPPAVVFGTSGAVGTAAAGFALADHSHDLNLTEHDKILTYTPEWTAAPGEGGPSGGTIVGRYRQIGPVVEVWVHIAFGSSVQGGVGPLFVSLPVVPSGVLPEQSLTAKLWTPQFLAAGEAATWAGQVNIYPGNNRGEPMFPTGVSDTVLRKWRNQTVGSGGPGTGIPGIPSQFTVQPGGRFTMTGKYLA